MRSDSAQPAAKPYKPIGRDTIILSFDIESNGLHGKAFAVGSVLMNMSGKVIDEFEARCPIRGEVDPWVRKNVLPALIDMPTKYPSGKALREAFWGWYKPAKAQADYVVVNNGYPVETRFLAACQDEDIENRYWDHPFPMLDLSSLLLQVGIKPLEVRHRLVEDQLGNQELQHHPRFDAWVSGLVTIKALKLSGQLK
jgi:hypothetical protein